VSGRTAANVAADFLKQHFVCVAVNCHNLDETASSDGEQGKFFAAHNVRGNWHMVITADGRELFGHHLGVNTDVLGHLNEALQKWNKLPESVRKPGGITLPEPKSAPRKALIAPPQNGLVLRVFQRNLKRGPKGAVALITKKELKDRKLYPDIGWEWGENVFAQPMPDVMWLREAEWKALVPPNPKKNDQLEVPASVKMRLFRYHLTNGTFGLPGEWRPKEIRRGELKLTVEAVSPVVRLRLHGSALLATGADLAKAMRGYDAQLSGILEYDPAKKAFTRFDLVSLGDFWGGDYEGNRFIRPGRNPFGIAFELASGDRPTDLVPPRGMPFKNFGPQYFAAEKE
jgi:hypothetical protein